jgi:hypothetical protein
VQCYDGAGDGFGAPQADARRSAYHRDLVEIATGSQLPSTTLRLQLPVKTCFTFYQCRRQCRGVERETALPYDTHAAYR